MTQTPDLLAELTHLDANAEAAAARGTRPEFVTGQEMCRAAVVAPRHDVGLGQPLRAALAARMAQLNACEPLASHYRDLLAAVSSDANLADVSRGLHPAGADARLRAILRHADLITVAPRACTGADTRRLVTDGLTVPEVVALSELIGFVNFEVRIFATLGLLALEGSA